LFSNLELSRQLSTLQLSTASLARKQHNYALAERLLLGQVATLMSCHAENGRVATPTDDLMPALASLRAANGGISQLDILKV
jgi:hypothetical protein